MSTVDTRLRGSIPVMILAGACAAASFLIVFYMDRSYQWMFAVFGAEAPGPRGVRWHTLPVILAAVALALCARARPGATRWIWWVIAWIAAVGLTFGVLRLVLEMGRFDRPFGPRGSQVAGVAVVLSLSVVWIVGLVRAVGKRAWGWVVILILMDVVGALAYLSMRSGRRELRRERLAGVEVDGVHDGSG